MSISRRDFLKFSALLTASTYMQPAIKLLDRKTSADPSTKNILLVVFDAFSATNVNFYGYPRVTMPNLTRLLERATIYHNHYASSNFTTPGTASILTGRYPWAHGAIKLSQEVRSEITSSNIFSLFDKYYKTAFTHNHFADIFLHQFSNSISLHEPYQNLFLNDALSNSSPWFNELMKNDLDVALLFKILLSDTTLDGFVYSLLFPSLLGTDEYKPSAEIAALFPEGVPEADGRGPFILEDAVDWAMQQSISMPQPFLGYFHFYPPHSPYHTRAEFINTFLDDGLQVPEKPKHPIIIPRNFISYEAELEYRRTYDEFLLYVDAEFNRLFTYLDQHGILENTLLIVTSDHGELFERRAKEHNEPYLFEPVVKIPLIIFEPGQTERRDVHTLTSCIDLLPTLLHYSGQEIPAALPGKILPPFNQLDSDSHRAIYAIDARLNYSDTHITSATLMMRKDNFKVIRYSGYVDAYEYYGHTGKLDAMENKSEVYYEVYDLENDPEELTNIADDPSPETQALIDELEQFYRENVEYPQ